MQTLIPAVLYLRRSREHQEMSIKDQRAAAKAYAVKHGYQIIREYVDDGISGDQTEDRLGFLTMIADATAKHDFEAILVWDQDRFGRFNSLEAGYYIHPLMKAKVTLVDMSSGPIDWNDYTDRVIYALKQEAKHQFLKDLARNVLRGLIARAKQGLWVAGMPPYGYAIGEDERLVPGNPEHIETVQRIFRFRVEDRLGYRVIARLLNQDKIPAPSGRPWSHDAVRCIITRETYCGVILYGGRRQGRYFTTDGTEAVAIKGKKRRTESIRIDDAHPALVSRKTFDSAQAMLTKAKPHWRNGKEGAPLAGLLKCGRCGAPMYAQSLQRKAGQKSPNYICGTYHKGHGCGYCSVPQKATLDAVARAVRAKVLLGSLDKLEKAIERELAARAKGKDVMPAAAYARQLGDLDRKIANATDRLVSVEISLVPTVEVKMLELQQQRKALVDAQKAAKAPAPKIDAKKIAARLWQLNDVLDKSSPSKVRAALSALIGYIQMDFEPAEANGRGERFSFVGGTIHPHTQACGSPARAR